MKIAIDLNEVIRDYLRQFIKYYKKGVDEKFAIEYDDVTDFDLFNVFPFKDDYGEPDRAEFNRFRFEDYAYELYARADVMDRHLPTDFGLWTQNALTNFDEKKVPEIMLVCPLEMSLAIQSTLSFLSRTGCRTREIWFPVDSRKIWDRCDLLVTANPNLISIKPEGKTAIKVEAPYNKDAACEYTFESMMDVIHDERNTVANLIENFGEKS